MSTAAETALLATLLMSTPSNEQLTTPSRNTQVRVNQPKAVVGKVNPKMKTPTASSRTASARLTMATSMILPMKYDVAVAGVPRSRRNAPVSRSAAMLMPRLMNDVDRMP